MKMRFTFFFILIALIGCKDPSNKSNETAPNQTTDNALQQTIYFGGAIITMDGVGEWSTTSLAIGESNNIDIHKEILFPHSIGLLYSAFTYFCGFKVNSGTIFPLGLPRCAIIIIFAFFSIKYFIVGKTFSMREFSDMAPLFIGTLKSTLINIRLFLIDISFKYFINLKELILLFPYYFYFQCIHVHF